MPNKKKTHRDTHRHPPRHSRESGNRLRGGIQPALLIDFLAASPGVSLPWHGAKKSIAPALNACASNVPMLLFHPYRWYIDANWMVSEDFFMSVHDLRPKANDSEKITINLGFIDLGQIDLLVQEGFYSNRTDFIRTAIRNQLATHAEVVKQTVVRKTLMLGLVEFTRADLEGVKKSGKQLRIQVLGLARIATDVSAALALATIESVSVLGAFQASPAVKAALANRI